MKHIFKMLLAISCVCLFWSSSVRSAVAEDTTAFTLDLTTANNQEEYLTGSNVLGYISIRLSGSKTVLKNTKLKITVPKEWLDAKFNNNLGMKGSTAFSLSGDPTVESDNENYYLTFHLKPVSGGQYVKLPFVFQTSNFTTPDGSIIPIKGEFIDEAGQVLASKTKVVINRSQQVLLSEDQNRVYYESTRRTEPVPPNTPSELSSNEFFYISTNRAAGASEGALGVYKTNNVKLTLQVEPDVYFDTEKNSSWSWNEQTRTATKIVSAPTATWFYDQGIYFKKADQPYGERFKVGEYTVVALDHKGGEIESSRSSVATLEATIFPKPAPQPVGTITDMVMNKSVTENKTLIYRFEDENKVTKWEITATNNSRFSNPDGLPTDGLTLPSTYVGSLAEGYIAPELSHPLSKFLNIYSIELAASPGVNAQEVETNRLVAYYIDGTKATIRENVKLGERVYFLNQNEVEPGKRLLSVEFFWDNPRVEIPPAEWIKMYVETAINKHDWDNATLPKGEKNWFTETDPNKELLNTPINNSAVVRFAGNRTNGLERRYDFDQMVVASGGDTLLSLPAQSDSVLFRKESVTSTSVLTIKPKDKYSDDPQTDAEIKKLMRDSEYDVYNGKYITLLPVGWNYIPENSFVTYTNTSGQTVKIPAPEVIYDYKGTGQRALVVQVDGLEERDSFTPVSISVELQALDETPRGESKVLTYFSHENDNIYYEIGAVGSRTEDTHDFDNDGNTTEMIPYIERVISYAPPEESIARMYIGRTLDSLRVGVSDAMDAGDTFWYGYEVENLLTEYEIRSMTLFAIKSFEGNLTQVPNNDGEYSDLHTTKTPVYLSMM